MLINFSVSNYTSFKEKVVFSMERSSIQKHREHLIGKDKKLLSGAVIYGANASGKTNLLQAIALLADTVVPRLRGYNGVPVIMNNIFNLDSDLTPEFEINFIKNSIKYTYLLSVHGNAIKREVFSFWKSNKEINLFERNGLEVKFGKYLSDDWYGKDKTAVPDVPFISALQKSYGIVSNKIQGYEHFDNALTFFGSIEYISEKSVTLGARFYEAFKKDEFRNYLLKLLQAADTGIEGVEFVPAQPLLGVPVPIAQNGIITAQIADNLVLIHTNDNGIIKSEKLVTIHKGCKIPFELGTESAGILKLIHLSLGLYMQKQLERVLLLDELDSLLHPIITKQLLQELLNMGGEGQIITALHNTSLLSHDIWRVDEIWFTEKNDNGESRLYPLTDINPRFDKDLEKDYINGKYGAVPFIGGWKSYAKN